MRFGLGGGVVVSRMSDRGMARVGYEVSSVVPPPGTSRMVTGIGRVIEEHLARLRSNPGLNLRVVGAFAEDWNPVVTSIATERWAAHSCVPPIASLRTFKTKSALGKAAADLLYRLEKRANRSAHASGIRRRALLLATALVRRIVHASVKVGVGPDEIDLFHSPFRAPPEWLHRSIPRVVTIHDVIPLRHAEEAGPDAAGMLKTVLAALNPTRDVVVAVSQFTKDDFCELSGFPSERVVVAHLSAGPIFRPVQDQAMIGSSSLAMGSGKYPISFVGGQPSAAKEHSLSHSVILQPPPVSFPRGPANWFSSAIPRRGSSGNDRSGNRETPGTRKSRSCGPVGCRTRISPAFIRNARHFSFPPPMKALDFLCWRRCSARPRSSARIGVRCQRSLGRPLFSSIRMMRQR